MNLFPFFMDIQDKTFLVVGGGAVALEKIESLRRFGAKMLVVARETDLQGAEDEGIRVLKKDFEESDLDRADFVIGATSDKALNARIAACCRERGIPVNIVDDAALCVFTMPSMVKRGDLTVAVSTNGTSPAYAMHVRKQIEGILPDHIEEILLRMEQLRGQVPARIPSQAERKKLYKAILLKMIETDGQLPEEDIERMIAHSAAGI